jgi:NADPH-dependent 2,4-dienoyl-CoA reductase/sulfur reductase-like enzyme
MTRPVASGSGDPPAPVDGAGPNEEAQRLTERLVVVGGGAAGMSAASAARRVDPDLDILVLEATGYAAWGLCGIPYYAAGVVGEPGTLVSHPPDWFREVRGIDLRLHTRAVALDAERHVVTLDDGADIAYATLVVTAGAAPVLPPIPGLDDARVFTVRTLESAIALRRLLDAGAVRRCMVVGAGYVGLEMSEGLVAQGCDVIIAELLPQVMATLDPEVATVVEATVRAHTDLRLGVALRALSGARQLVADLTDGTRLEVDAVVVATGVRPQATIASAAGATAGPGGALLVDDAMRTSLPDVFAAGDCVAAYHRVLRRPAWVPLGPTANKTGRVAGTVAAGGTARFAGVVGTAVCKVFDLTVARTGLTLAEAQAHGLAATATDSDARSRAAYYPGAEPTRTRLVHGPDGQLLGAQMVSADPATAKRIDVVATALHAGFDVATLADLDLSYAPPYAPVYDPVLRAAQAVRPAATGASA